MKTLLIAFIGALFAFLFNLYVQYCITRNQEYCELKKAIFMFNIHLNFIKNIEYKFNCAYKDSKAGFLIPQELQHILDKKEIKYDWINYQPFLHTFKVLMPKEGELLFLAAKEYDQDILKILLSCIAAHDQLMNFISYRNNDFEKVKVVINNFVKYKNIDIDYDSDSFYSGQRFTNAIFEEVNKQKIDFQICIKKIEKALIERHWFYFLFHNFKPIMVGKLKFFVSAICKRSSSKDTILSFSLINTLSQTEYALGDKNDKKYHPFSTHTIQSIELIQTSIAGTLDFKADEFLRYYRAIYKHLVLAFLSTLRLQETQASLNIRQLLEVGACAAYSLGEPQLYNPTISTEIDLLNDKTRVNAYKWLEKNDPSLSNFLESIKKNINISYAHGGLFTACVGMEDDASNI
ncbi:MAG: hypothetical protein ACK4PR_12765, partial [Gammaproteobacteria bacterium]